MARMPGMPSLPHGFNRLLGRNSSIGVPSAEASALEYASSGNTPDSPTGIGAAAERAAATNGVIGSTLAISIPPADVAHALPDQAARKLWALRRERSDAFATIGPLHDERNAAIQDRARWDGRLRLLRDDTRFRAHNEHAIAEAEARVAECTQTIKRLDAEINTRVPRSAAIGGLLERTEQWLSALRGSSFAVHGAVEVELRRGENLTEAIDRKRRRLRELDADRQRIAASPVPSEIAKKRATIQIEALAAEGRPNVIGLVDLRDASAKIEWPMHLVRAQVVDPRSPINLQLLDNMAHPMGLMAWLFRDALVAKVCAEIDEAADDTVALDDATMAKKLAQIAADRLSVEREEEALITLAGDQGARIDRRRDADPRAVLGLASNLPHPEDVR